MTRQGGHVRRGKEIYVGQRMLVMVPAEKKRRGRPQRRHMDSIRKKMRELGAKETDIQDRSSRTLKADFHSPISGARATFSERHFAITWCVSNYTSAIPTQNEGFKIQSFAAYSECIFRGQSKLPACS